VAEGARLESVFTRKGNVGSNPTLSAMFSMAYKERNHWEISFPESAIFATLEFAVFISSVTTPP
jgi:hypothetical protein